jgi:hypothetical protein
MMSGTSKAVSQGPDNIQDEDLIGIKGYRWSDVTRSEDQKTFGWHATQAVCICAPFCGILHHLTDTQSHHGLSSVPSALQPFREEVGLAGADWDALGPEWQALATLWLRAETWLSKSGRSELTLAEIRTSSIPDEWKHWMSAKLMKTNTNPPSESFGQVFTDYLDGLPSSVLEEGGTVMAQEWCRPGRTGIVGLLLCLYWQAECSGTGPGWKANMKRVEQVFNAILAHPDL